MGIQQVLATHAAASVHGKEPFGMELIAFGIIATAAGLLAVINFRGAADAAGRSDAEMKKAQRNDLTPWVELDAAARRDSARTRAVGGVFALVGPVVLIIGIVASLHGHFATPDAAPAVAPIRYLFLAAGGIAIICAWTRRLRGFLLTMARQGRWQCAWAVLVSIGMAVFVVSLAYGRMTIFFAVLLGFPLLSVALFLAALLVTVCRQATQKLTTVADHNSVRFRRAGADRQRGTGADGRR